MHSNFAQLQYIIRFQNMIFVYFVQGFVIVSALLVTALLQFIFDGKPPSLYCLVALPLVMTSISIYQKYPYRLVKEKKEE